MATLEKIYDQQHFFIDRHETIAEKLLTALTILGGFVSIVLSFLPWPLSNSPISPLFQFIVVLFFGFFVLSLYVIINTIRPLSSKALKEPDTQLLPKEPKKWIKLSLIYYRGITKLAESCYSDGKNAVDEYKKELTKENMINDYIQQILILAHYSDYKRDQLEVATKLTILTSIFGGIALIIMLGFRVQ